MARMLPLMTLAIFGVVAFGWRSWYHRRRFGFSGVVLFRSGRWVQHLRECLLVILIGLLVAQAVIVAVAPDARATLPVGHWPATGLWLAVGAAFVIAGLGLMVAAQLEMGVSWRVGVDEAARPGLVTRGVYRFSRNPIYLAMFVSLAGFTLLMPTWPTLAVFAVSVAAIHNQVRSEERYLQRAYGDAYAAYARRVGRFVPGLGTLDA
jgi:protein-S-isoprenylcysteine O-methyltransferase Ste14